MNLYSCVCATVERHTKILCQSNSLSLKGVVLFYALLGFDIQNSDCVTLCLSIVDAIVFQSEADVCVTLCFWEDSGHRWGIS